MIWPKVTQADLGKVRDPPLCRGRARSGATSRLTDGASGRTDSSLEIDDASPCYHLGSNRCRAGDGRPLSGLSLWWVRYLPSAKPPVVNETHT